MTSDSLETFYSLKYCADEIDNAFRKIYNKDFDPALVMIYIGQCSGDEYFLQLPSVRTEMITFLKDQKLLK
jgi:hypothetical protein